MRPHVQRRGLSRINIEETNSAFERHFFLPQKASMKLISSVTVAGTLLWMLAHTAAFAQSRMALVIGNSEYPRCKPFGKSGM